MTDRELMQQVLDALDSDNPDIQLRTAVALRNRMSQPEPLFSTPDVTFDVIDCPRCGHCCPHRKWVGLTKEEAKEISMANRPYVIDMIAALEARLKEKNT
jgi:pyruvate/2-oxoglutarate dehydrogenase complex dihydrolipoamide dehydrogenase (E3) component